MWPTMTAWGRTGYPDCRSNGPHRWGRLHFVTKDNRKEFVRACRHCEAVKPYTLDHSSSGKLIVVKEDSPQRSQRE